MELIDEILEFLHYHPRSKRVDVERCLTKNVSPATVKRIISKGISDGYISVAGIGKATAYSITPKAHLLRTVDLDSYYAQDHDERNVQTGYNFDLIRETLPAVSIFSEIWFSSSFLLVVTLPNSSLISTDSTSPIKIFVSFGTLTSASVAIVCAVCPTIFALSAPFMMIVFLIFSVSSLFKK